MKDTIVLHHTDDPGPDPQFAKVNASHKARGFPKSKLGWYVGYHFFIGKEGTVKKARQETEIGAHAVNCGCKSDHSGHAAGTINVYSIGVCLAGDFLMQAPTHKQIRSLTLLLMDLQNRFHIADTRLFLHREVKATACPGVDLRGMYFVDRVNYWREQADEVRGKMHFAAGAELARLKRKLARLEKLLP